MASIEPLIHMLHARFLVALLLFPACKREPPPIVVRDIPPIAQPKTLAVPSEPETIAPVGQWSTSAPHARGTEYSMTRDADHLVLTRRDTVIELPAPTLSDCLDHVPEIETPEDMPQSKVSNEPAWLKLTGNHEAASIRLSTRGALLIANDGCLRVADLTPALLGTPADTEDPIFGTDQLAPDDSSDSTDLAIVRDGTTTHVQRNQAPWIDVHHFPGDVTLGARALDKERWARLVIATETESRDGESAVGREQTLVWTAAGEEPPVLALNNDFRFGADGPDHEENRTTTARAHRLPTGLLYASGERTSIDNATNVGAGRCPEMEGVLAYRHRMESVTWTFEARDGTSTTLGESTREATFASGCLNVALKATRARRRLLADRAPDDKVTWQSATQPTEIPTLTKAP